MKLLAFLICLFLGSAAVAQPKPGQSPQPPVAPGGYAYQLHIPRDYWVSPRPGWPVIVFLHGSGERGSDIAKVKIHGIPKIVERPGEHPYIAISPLLPADEDWDIPKLNAILDHVMAKYRTDASRVYLTGLSRGGRASWRWAAAEPTRFAALAPVSGGGDPSQACRLKALPIWAFHGDRDDVVTPWGTFTMVEAIRSCGGKPRLTIYPDTGHDGWTPTYDNPAFYTWLLAQRRADPIPPTQDEK